MWQIKLETWNLKLTLCKLWQQFGWQLLYWNAEGYTSYVCHTVYPFQKYKFTHYCMWDIDWKTLFQNVWIIEDMVDLPIIGCALHPASTIVKPWLTTWSKIVALISSDMRLCPWPLPLFCLCTLSPCILTPLLLLGCWPWSFSRCCTISSKMLLSIASKTDIVTSFWDCGRICVTSALLEDCICCRRAFHWESDLGGLSVSQQ